MSEDPIGFSGAHYNLYRYVSNNPTKYTDPSGENPFLILVGVVLGSMFYPEKIAPEQFPPASIPSPNNINPSAPPWKLKEKLEENKDFENSICQK